MSAETLRRAATELRATARGAAPGTVSDPAVALAVATWLDSHADIHALRTCDERLIVPCPALAVARAYLGESA